MNQLILVRHGETVGNSAVRLHGRTDVALSATGREQMRRAGAALRGIAFRAVYVSPLARSRESAAVIADGRLPAPIITPEFSEIDFGEWEGLTFEEAAARDPANYEKYKRGYHDFRFPGGDSKPEFFGRVARAAVAFFSDAPLPALAVLHKGVIRGVIAALLGVQPRALSGRPIELGSIHRLERSDAGGWAVLSENETAHLGDTRIPES